MPLIDCTVLMVWVPTQHGHHQHPATEGNRVPFLASPACQNLSSTVFPHQTLDQCICVEHVLRLRYGVRNGDWRMGRCHGARMETSAVNGEMQARLLPIPGRCPISLALHTRPRHP